MEKICLYIAFILLGIGTSFASNKYVGGNIGIFHNSTTKVTSASVLPEIWYNLSDKLALGTSIGYSYVGKDDDVHNHSFVFDPYVRYTFYNEGIVSLFVDGGIDLSAGTSRTERTEHYEYKNGHYYQYIYQHVETSVTIGVGIKPGIAVSLNDNFSIVAHCGLLGYTYGNPAAQEAGRFTGGGLDLSNILSFGFYFNL